MKDAPLNERQRRYVAKRCMLFSGIICIPSSLFVIYHTTKRLPSTIPTKIGRTLSAFGVVYINYVACQTYGPDCQVFIPAELKPLKQVRDIVPVPEAKEPVQLVSEQDRIALQVLLEEKKMKEKMEKLAAK